MVLYMLSSSPKNGVELMDGVESLTRGHWRPTPGSIYPLLRFLTEDGIIRKLEDNRYELTEKGRAQAEESFGKRRRGARSASEMLDQMDGFVSFMEDSKTTSPEVVSENATRLKNFAKRLNKLVKDEQGENES